MRIAYNIAELIDCEGRDRIVGFRTAPWQPYRNHSGLRLSAPNLNEGECNGFTEIMRAGDGLHAIITDWTAGASMRGATWAEFVGDQYGYLYIGLEGDGRVDVEGLGRARRRGPSCSLTIAPPGSTYLWRTEPGLIRRGVCIAFHARYLQRHYPQMLARCGGTLGPWLADRETQLRDFEVPLLPIMMAATAGLLNMTLEAELREHFVRATVEQLLCLAIAALAKRGTCAGRLSTRDRNTIEEVRAALDANLANPPSVEQLARRFGTNRNKLGFGFKETFGLSVSDYLSEQRMRIAFDMLASGRTSVTEVAAAAGYRHLCNFTTAFKRRFGRPPSQWQTAPRSAD